MPHSADEHDAACHMHQVWLSPLREQWHRCSLVCLAYVLCSLPFCVRVNSSGWISCWGLPFVCFFLSSCSHSSVSRILAFSLFCFDFILYLLLFFFLSCVFPSLSINLAAPQFLFSIFVPLLLLSYYICSFSLPYLLSVLLPSVLAFSPRSHSFAWHFCDERWRSNKRRLQCAQEHFILSFDFNAIIISMPLATLSNSFLIYVDMCVT